MRIIRYRDTLGEVRLALEQETGGNGRPVFADVLDASLVDALEQGVRLAGGSISADVELLSLGGENMLLTPLDAPELWCAGLTYAESGEARVRESELPEPYERVFTETRPELLLKDAGGRRTVASGRPIAVRSDSVWSVPEPEIGLVLGSAGSILGYTIGIDVTARDIRAVNPVYATQAKVYRASCALGPSVYVERNRKRPFSIFMLVTDETGREVFAGRATTAGMQRSFEQLAEWVSRENDIPPGSVLLTGAAIVPPEDFALQRGYTVEVHVPEIGTLSNPVVVVADMKFDARVERLAVSASAAPGERRSAGSSVSPRRGKAAVPSDAGTGEGALVTPLVTRIRGLVRRSGVEHAAEPARASLASPDEPIEVGELRLDPEAGRVWRAGVEIRLAPKALAVLEALMRRPGEVLSRTWLIESAWGPGFADSSNIVDAQVRRLRRGLDEPFPEQLIETVRGEGYRLREPAR